RLGLHLAQFPRHLSGAPCRPPSNPALYAADERQSRAVHSDRAARVGVPPSLLHLSRACAAAPPLDPALQLRTPAWQLRSTAPDESLPRREQPYARSQLATARTAFRRSAAPALRIARRRGSAWSAAAAERRPPRRRYGRGAAS